MMSFHDCSFYLIIKRHSQFLFSKIAEAGDHDVVSSRGMGTARVLIEAVDYFKRTERVQRSPSPPPMVQQGRVGAPGMTRRMVKRHPSQNPGAVNTYNLRGRARSRGFSSYSLPCPGRGFR